VLNVNETEFWKINLMVMHEAIKILKKINMVLFRAENAFLVI